MAKEDIPVQESKFKGHVVEDVPSAQRIANFLLAEQDNQKNVQDSTSAVNDVEQSVDTEIDNSQELTVDDLVEHNTEKREGTPEMVTVNVDGKTMEVSLDELKSGYSRTADYTKKTMAMSEKQKELEQEKAQTVQARDKYLEALENYNSEMDSEVKQLEGRLTMELQQSDPTEYYKLKDRLNDIKNARTKSENEKNILTQQKKEEQEKHLKKLIEENNKYLSRELPEILDPTKGTELKAEIRNYGIKQGYSEQEMNSIIDARSILILNKARKYDDLVAAKLKNKKVPVRVTKPGSGVSRSEIDTEKYAKTRNRLKRTGSVDDAAAAMKAAKII